MNHNRHTLRAFDVSLDSLRSEVLAMGAAVTINLERAVHGLLKGNMDECNSVIADDETVDQYEKDIDELAMSLMMRFNPVATDLRMVISSMNVSRSLERISDHAVNIARRARKILRAGENGKVQMVEPLYAMAALELREAITAYADGSVERALGLHDRDAELDRAHKKLAKGISRLIEEQEGNVVQLIHLLFVLRSLERVGDLAVNIGEEVVFIESAEDIRHQ